MVHRAGKEIADLRQRLCQTGKAAIGQAISGLGGIGKTQTAIEYAHRYRDQYDAVFWINAASDLDLTDRLPKGRQASAASARRERPGQRLGGRQTLVGEVDGHCWLLVFDNADDPPLLKPCLPSKAPNGHILVTSRMRLDVLGIRSPLSIENLPVEDSTRFLLDRADRAPGAEAERQAAQEWPANSMDSPWPWSRQRPT